MGSRRARCSRALRSWSAWGGSSNCDGGGTRRLSSNASADRKSSAELRQYRRDEALAAQRVGLGALHELIAAGGLDRARRDAPEFEGFVAELGVHDASRSARANRIRCISMLPDANVEACEWRQ